MRKIVVGVWKDRLGLVDSLSMARDLVDQCSTLDASEFTAAVAPAPYAAQAVVEVLKGSAVQAVYQDIHWPAPTGSYMGSTPISVVQELEIRDVMVGHSERRRFFGEDDASIQRKLIGLVGAGVTPILCVGDDVEDWAERRRILVEQLTGALMTPTGPAIDLSQVIIAYEPVWAISTWRSERPLPTGDEVAEMLALVRQTTEQVCEVPTADTSFLFGGSVGPTNADEYFSTDGVDGALVGGASLSADSMAEVFRAASRAWDRAV